MTRAPYFPFYPTDFMHGVRGLSAQEVGVYTMLLCLIYEENGPVEYHVRRLSTYCGMREATFTKVVTTLIDLGKITLRDNRISNERAELEIAKRANGLKFASAAGKASAEKRQQNQRPSPTTVAVPFNHTESDTDTELDGGGSAGARDLQPAEASQPKTFREKMLEAVGVDPVSGLTGRGGAQLGTQADMLEARRWFTDLKLTPTEVLAVVAEAMQRKPDGPPNRFSYFTKAMQRYAATKAAAAQPLAPSPHAADATHYRPDMPPKPDMAAIMDIVRRNREARDGTS